MVDRGALYAAGPRFSVYLEALALERERAAAVDGVEEGACACDSVEVSEEARRRLGERGEVQSAPEVEEVELVRERLTSPAGRFLDLFV